jgi:signal transduction histidine kinase
VALVSQDGAWLEKVADVGLPGRALVEWQRFPSRGPYPAADVVATRRPQFLPDRETYVTRYPEAEPSLRALDIEASAVLPLAPAADGPAVGYLGFHYAAPHAFPAEERAFFGALAQVTAQALERARLFEAEQAARAEAQAANRVKSEFLATMSHELRTPLNAIAGYAELLQLGIHGPVTDGQREALGRIQRSQMHLLAVINEVLNYARLEAGAVQYSIGVVDLASALASVASLVLPQVEAKGLRLAVTECDERLAVRADVEKLDQVLLNLLSNAVKFTESGGEIAISCQAHTTPHDRGAAGSYVTIAIADTGIGIPADQLERIFEPFVQVGRALNSPVEGTGLGLAISRDLARGMGGELTVVSEVGYGSIFALTLQGA